MAYTNAWSVTGPPIVGAAANTIGVAARQLRLDLQERFQSTLIVDMTADPIVIRDAVAGIRAGDQWIVPHCAFLSDLNGKLNNIDADDGRISVFVNTQHLYAPLPSFLRGCSIVLVEWLVDIHNTTSLDMSLMSRPFTNAPAAATSINTKNIAVGGANIVNGGAFTHTVDASRYYYLKIGANGGAGNEGWVYGARITFNRPS